MIKVKKRKILLLPGDGIGPEVIAEVKKIIQWFNKNKSLDFEIDLKEEKILFGNNELKFKIDPFKKKCLIEGLDDIALSLEKSSHINEFEKKVKSVRPWIFND